MINYGWHTYIFSIYTVYNIKEIDSKLCVRKKPRGGAVRNKEKSEIRGFCSFMNHPFIFLPLSLIRFPLICCVFCSSLYSRPDVITAIRSRSLSPRQPLLQFPNKPSCPQYNIISVISFPPISPPRHCSSRRPLN